MQCNERQWNTHPALQLSTSSPKPHHPKHGEIIILYFLKIFFIYYCK